MSKRSFFNVTRVSIKERLPDSADTCQLMIVSSDPDATVNFSTAGFQCDYPPIFRQVLQVISFITWLSFIFLLLYSYAHSSSSARSAEVSDEPSTTTGP